MKDYKQNIPKESEKPSIIIDEKYDILLEIEDSRSEYGHLTEKMNIYSNFIVPLWDQLFSRTNLSQRLSKDPQETSK